jgi:Icc-related predicted phosphoesterase
MKLRILADLHLEFNEFEYKNIGEDLLILAGDTHVGTKGIAWAKTLDTPVLYVLGNHEYYKHNLSNLVGKMKVIAKNSNVTVLENESIIINDILFFGATLWTDLNLNHNVPIAELIVQNGMNDFNLIKVTEKYRKFLPVDWIRKHKESRAALIDQCGSSPNSTVIITHHGPMPESINKRYHGNPMNVAYVSDMRSIVDFINPKLWIHGHTHCPTTYKWQDTTFIVNPRGYKYNGEESNWNPNLIYEL